jgi:DNA-binding transcriptional regulator YhcF (GntR family)
MVKFTLDRNCSLSYYEQVKGQIISCLYTGKLREGDRLPTIRQMAEDLGVNYKTVQKIYNRLQQEGYVEVNRGSGAFIRRQKESEFEELRRKAISNLIKDALDRANRLGLSPEKFAALLDNYIAPSQHKTLSCVVVDDEEEALVFSKELQRRLGINAQPVPLALLEENENALFAKVRGIEYFLTTSWHLEQVRKYAFTHHKKVLEIKPNPQIYQEILKEVQTRNVAVVVQDARTIHASMEVFMNIYHPSTTKKFFISPIGDKEQLQAMLDEAELIYTSPLCWDEVRKLTPARVEIRTFKDFIAEESLEALREIRLFE